MGYDLASINNLGGVAMDWFLTGKVFVAIYFVCAIFNFGIAFALLDSRYSSGTGEESWKVSNRRNNIVASLVIAALSIPVTILVLMNNDHFLYKYGWRLPFPVK